MNISIVHRINEGGKDLLSTISNTMAPITQEEVEINAKLFRKLNILDENSGVERLLNSTQALLNCLNRDSYRRILNLNHIPMKRPGEAVISYYNILVFNNSAISIKHIARNRAHYLQAAQCSKAVEIGKKAVYLLGLDYAMVKVALTSQRRHTVIEVDPSPSNLRPRDLDKLLDRLKKIHHDSEFNVNTTIKLGADPEFMISHATTKRMIAASRFFSRYGSVGYDDLRRNSQHPIAEIRPKPSESPLVLTNNVQNALARAAKIAPYRNIKWVAGSQPYSKRPIGGHIHFSKIGPNSALLRALDNYLNIPVFLIENQHSAVRRRRRYGTLGDFRLKGYGGFEYRTLGSWLVSQQITRAVLCLAKIVVSHYRELNENYLIDPAAQRAFYRGNQEYFLTVFHDLWSEICATEMYKQYADEVEIIHQMILNGEHWNETEDLRRTWELRGSFRRVYRG